MSTLQNEISGVTKQGHSVLRPSKPVDLAPQDPAVENLIDQVAGTMQEPTLQDWLQLVWGITGKKSAREVFGLR